MNRPNGTAHAGGSMSSRELEHEVDRTRAAMDRTLDAIAGKLTPQQLMLEALGAFREGSSTLATKLVETAREHPVPATVIGLGIAMLLHDSRSSDADTSPRGTMDALRDRTDDARTAAAYGVHRVHDATTSAVDSVRESASSVAGTVRETAAETAERLRDRASHVAGAVSEKASSLAGAVGERASNVAERATVMSERLGSRLHDTAESVRQSAAQVPPAARQRMHDAQLGFWQYMDKSPLAVGAAALAAGVAAGLTVPSTRCENEWMGPARDSLLDRGKERVQGVRSEVMDKGRDIARTAAEVARTEAQRQGLTPETLVDKLRTVVRETEQAVRTEAKGAVPDTLKG